MALECRHALAVPFLRKDHERTRRARAVMKRISLDVREQAGIVVSVTFPLPLVGTLKTVDVAVSDEMARELIAKLEAILAARGVKRLQP